MEKPHVLDGLTRPDVLAASKYLGAADEMPPCPVGERDLAAGRGGVIGAHDALFDQINPRVRRTLTEDGLAARNGEGASEPAHRPLLLGREPIEKVRTLVEVIDDLAEIDRARRVCARAHRRDGPVPRWGWLAR